MFVYFLQKKGFLNGRDYDYLPACGSGAFLVAALKVLIDVYSVVVGRAKCVAGDGSVVGLEPDFRTLKKKDRDGLGLFLTDLLLDTYGRDLAPCIRVTFHPLDGKEVCQVAVSRSPRPVYLKEGNDEVLYLRTGNSTRRLSVRDALEYAKTRWG